MAFPAETVTETLVAMSHVLLRVNSNATCCHHPPGPTNVGRVVDVTDIDTGEVLYEHLGHDSNGAAQIAALFVTRKGSGKFRVTLDEVYDADGETWLGDQIDVDLRQVYAKATSKGHRLLCAKARLSCISIKPNTGTPTTMVIAITPYNAPGSAAWTHDHDASM